MSFGTIGMWIITVLLAICTLVLSIRPTVDGLSIDMVGLMVGSMFTIGFAMLASLSGEMD